MKFDLGSQFLDGEFKLVVKDKEGNIKQETDWQHNLFLENGMKFVFGAGGCVSNLGNEDTSNSYNPAAQLIIGTGSTDPNINQTAMVAPQKVVAVDNTNREFVKEEPTSILHPGFVKLTNTLQYTFEGFTEGLNITEIGLCANSKNWNNPSTREYLLTTRALIKANDNVATAITVLPNEVLVVYYKISIYVDIKRKTGEFTLTTTDAQNNTRTDTFEYFIQPYNVASTASYFRLNAVFGSQGGKTIESYGVKEPDSELSSSYSLTDDVYNSITHLDISPINKKISTSEGSTLTKTSTLHPMPYNGPITGNDHGRGYLEEYDYSTKRMTVRATSGINTHTWNNGIRAFIFRNKVNISLPPTVASYLVVVKNKANGQGIKKTNLHEWTLDYTITMGRWNGD